MIVDALMRPRKILITILLGNEFSNIALSIVGAAAVSHMSSRGPIADMLIAVAIITPLIMILGEIVPKNLAIRFAERFAILVIVPLTLFSRIMSPLRAALTAVADFFISLFGGSATEQPMIMEQEYRQLIDLGRREGVIIEEERKLIHNIFEFSDNVVTTIMTPANRIFSLNIATPYEKILEQLKSEGYSRVPFYETHRENIIGILHVQDLFTFDARRHAASIDSLRELLIPPLFVEPNQKLEDLLRDFRQKRIHMALVKKSGGPIEGLITMHDVLVNLFGEIEE